MLIVDELIKLGLLIYPAFLIYLFVFFKWDKIKGFLFFILCVRFLLLGLRSQVGGDIANYTNMLSSCDLSSINSFEFFWLGVCKPSAILYDALGFPFIVVGLIDTYIFYLLVKQGYTRIAVLHDFIYFPTQELGAIRQAIAMKLILLLVLHMSSFIGKNEKYKLSMLPAVHLASAAFIFIYTFINAKLLNRLILVVSSFFIVYFIIGEELILKIYFYLSFEGYRSTEQIYISWIKRFIIISMSLVFLKINYKVYKIYLIGVCIGFVELKFPEVAVRLGAYFEQFETAIITSPMRRKFRRLYVVWMSLWLSFYILKYYLSVSKIL